MFERILGNWQTTVAGLAVIAMSAIDSFVYDLPQWDISFGASFTIAIGLILAKDASTGSLPGAKT